MPQTDPPRRSPRSQHGNSATIYDQSAATAVTFQRREFGTKYDQNSGRNNLNAHLERFVRSLKQECLNKMIFFGEASLQSALTEYVGHYHHERNHQGLDNRIPFPVRGVGARKGRIRHRDRLGGLLRYYYRDAA